MILEHRFKYHDGIRPLFQSQEHRFIKKRGMTYNIGHKYFYSPKNVFLRDSMTNANIEKWATTTSLRNVGFSSRFFYAALGLRPQWINAQKT